MKSLWRIELVPGPVLEIQLQEFTIIKQTALQYHYDRGEKVGRVNKIALDREPGILGGGRWYTTREKALESWVGFHTKEARIHTDIAVECLKMKGVHETEKTEQS